MVQLQQELADDVAAVSLNLDFSGEGDTPAEYEEDVLAFLTEINASEMDNVIASDSFTTVMEALEMDAVPVVRVYGRDGQLVKTFNGETYEDEISPFVKTLLRKEQEASE